MAIYKLGDIAEIKRGSSPRPILNWLTEDDTKLPWAKISDINNNQINLTKQFVNNEWKEKGLIGNYDDLFVTNSATPGVPFIQKNKSKIAYHDGFLKVSPNENIVLKKYLFFKLIIDRPKLLLMGNGAVFINLSSEILKDWKINLPSISDQQKIIDIIEPKEDLFLKFSNTVRIDTFEHTKNDLKNLIDIIEPVEFLLNQIIRIRNKLLNFIKNLPFQDKKERISYFLEPIKNKPKHLNQISAKVLNDQGLIDDLEDINTYKTNNFFTPRGTFVFCSIRTYLKKWGLTPYDVDSNGTLFQFSIKNNITSLIAFLMNNDAWERFNLLSSGTKMPVIKKKLFLNVEILLRSIEIKNVDQILISLNRLQLKTISLKEKIVKLLIK